MGCHRHWYQDIPLNSWCGRNSQSLAIWVASVAGAVEVGCMCFAGRGNAGCAAEKWCLVRACSVAVLPLGTVLTALTLHS